VCVCVCVCVSVRARARSRRRSEHTLHVIVVSSNPRLEARGDDLKDRQIGGIRFVRTRAHGGDVGVM
jgi:hypothetical protein